MGLLMAMASGPMQRNRGPREPAPKPARPAQTPEQQERSRARAARRRERWRKSGVAEVAGGGEVPFTELQPSDAAPAGPTQ